MRRIPIPSQLKLPPERTYYVSCLLSCAGSSGSREGEPVGQPMWTLRLGVGTLGFTFSFFFTGRPVWCLAARLRFISESGGEIHTPFPYTPTANRSTPACRAMVGYANRRWHALVVSSVTAPVGRSVVRSFVSAVRWAVAVSIGRRRRVDVSHAFSVTCIGRPAFISSRQFFSPRVTHVPDRPVACRRLVDRFGSVHWRTACV
jgi:hypothetical protein